jgi:hypothetical protein
MIERQQEMGVASMSNLAVLSLILSVLGILTGPLGFLPGIVCGHLALRRIRMSPHLRGRGVAIAGLVLGYFLLAAVIGGGILWWSAAVSVPPE